jgi:uncharacterized protein
VQDILKELEKPGRDPPRVRHRPFAEGVEEVKDLQPGMVLEGRVSKRCRLRCLRRHRRAQDGLVHVSALSHKFVKDRAKW